LWLLAVTRNTYLKVNLYLQQEIRHERFSKQ